MISAETSAAGPAARSVAMYRLPGASLVWRATLAARGPIRSLSYMDGMLLGVVESGPPETVALRPDTGQVPWRRPGWWHPDGAGNVVLWDRRPGEDVLRVQSVALQTGSTRWSLSVPAVETVMVEGGRLVRWSFTGRVMVHDARSGTELASMRLPDPLPEIYGRVAGGLVDHRGTHPADLH